MKKQKAPVTFLVDDKGILSLRDFSPRVFKDAIKPYLRKGWKSSGAALAKSISACPDLLSVVIGLQAQYEEILWAERQKIDARLSNAELPLTDEERQDQIDLRDAYDHVLSDIEAATPAQWVKKLPKKVYESIVQVLELFLSDPINAVWTVYQPALDTAEGRAVHLLRQLSAEQQVALGLQFHVTGELSLPIGVTTTLTPQEAQNTAEELGLAFLFETNPKRVTRRRLMARPAGTLKELTPKKPPRTKAKAKASKKMTEKTAEQTPAE